MNFISEAEFTGHENLNARKTLILESGHLLSREKSVFVLVKLQQEDPHSDIYTVSPKLPRK